MTRLIAQSLCGPNPSDEPFAPILCAYCFALFCILRMM